MIQKFYNSIWLELSLCGGVILVLDFVGIII